MHYWNSLKIGQVFTTDQLTLSDSDIIQFASEFDPQPYHLDPVAAAQSIFGGLCASGWQVCALMMRLLSEQMQKQQIPCSGAESVKTLRWFKPVYPGDTLSSTVSINALEASSRYETHGLMICDIDVTNQNGKSVIKLEAGLFIQHASAQ